MTEQEARTAAYDWHGGQWSPLYAFASTGHVGDGLVGEVRECAAMVKAFPGNYVDVDRRQIKALLAYVESL